MSAVMRDVVSDGTKSTKNNAERVATALNSLLNQLATAGDDCDVALVGYQTDAAGLINVGSRWGGSLTGRDFIPLRELAAAPLRMETRTRRIALLGGASQAREEVVNFPIWYTPTLGSKAPQMAAYNYCRDLLGRWMAKDGDRPPLLVHIQSGSSGDGKPQMAVDKLMAFSTPAGAPLVMQIHLAATAQAVSSLYPSSAQYLTVSSARDLFRCASVLPDQWVVALKGAKVAINKGARAMLYNAKIADVIRVFGLVKTHLQSVPTAVPGAASVTAPAALAASAVTAAPALAADLVAPELAGTGTSHDFQTGAALAVAEPGSAGAASSEFNGKDTTLIVFVLDRTTADPFDGNLQNSCAKLQDHANDLLHQVSRLTDGTVECVIVSYGLDSAGHVEVRTTFDGPLAGRTTVPNSELVDGALRVDEFTEEVSNGVGGLISITRKKPIYFDLKPTAAASSSEAFAAVARIVGDWAAQHPTACLSPIVLHLTRGAGDVSVINGALGSIREVSTAAGPVMLYHLVATEVPHKSLAYPASNGEIEDPFIRALWEATSPLLNRERLEAEKPSVSADSRGMVINGKFDLLLDGVKAALAG